MRKMHWSALLLLLMHAPLVLAQATPAPAPKLDPSNTAWMITASVLVLWLGGRMVLAGTLTVGTLVSFLLYAGQAAQSVGGIGQLWSMYQEATGAAGRVFEILNARPNLRDPDQPRAMPSPVPSSGTRAPSSRARRCRISGYDDSPSPTRGEGNECNGLPHPVKYPRRRASPSCRRDE